MRRRPSDAHLAAGVFAGVGLADAKARTLFAGISEDVVFRAVMLALDQPGGASVGARPAPVPALGVALLAATSARISVDALGA